MQTGYMYKCLAYVSILQYLLYVSICYIFHCFETFFEVIYRIVIQRKCSDVIKRDAIYTKLKTLKTNEFSVVSEFKSVKLLIQNFIASL